MDAQQTDKTPNTAISYDKALRYSIFLGLFGVDRFYIGDTRLGIIKCCFFMYLLPWIVDIFVIRSHKNDWDEWISAKHSRKAEVAAVKEQRQEEAKLHKERASNGQCPQCGSSNLTAVAKTTNKLSVLGGLTQLSNPTKFVPNDKMVSTIKRVCLNCGHEF